MADVHTTKPHSYDLCISPSISRTTHQQVDHRHTVFSYYQRRASEYDRTTRAYLTVQTLAHARSSRRRSLPFTPPVHLMNLKHLSNEPSNLLSIDEGKAQVSSAFLREQPGPLSPQ